jgi:DNA-binding CsgD family transcriptional regulator
MLARQLIDISQGAPGSRMRTELCLRLAREQGSRTDEGGALVTAAFERLFDGDTAGASIAMAAAAAIVDELADTELGHRVEHLAMLGWVELYLDEFTPARRHFTRGFELARKAGVHHLVPAMRLGLAAVHGLVGPVDRALFEAAETGRLAGDLGAEQLRSLALAQESQYVALTGERDPVAIAEQALALLPTDDRFGRTDVAIALAGAVLSNGASLRCTALIVDAGGGPTLANVPLIQQAGCFEMLAEAAAQAADPAAARNWARAAAAAAKRSGVGSHQGFVLGAQGHLLRAEGRDADAARRYSSAAKVFSEVRMIVAQARMLNLAASCAAAAGLFDEAGAIAVMATEIARQAGAWREYERARASQGDLDDRRDETRPLSEVLTSREVEIAQLATKGERTKEIAELLSLSPRTVEAHLRNIYRKLAVKTRAGLANRVLSTTGPDPE